MKELQRYLTAEILIESNIDYSHPARAENFKYLVGTNDASYQRFTGFVVENCFLRIGWRFNKVPRRFMIREQRLQLSAQLSVVPTDFDNQVFARGRIVLD